MKIALLHDSVLPPRHYGGIERVVLSLAKEYVRLGHQVVILCRKGSTLKEYETIHLPVEFDERDLPRLLPADCDFLHAHQPLKHKPPMPYLVTVHGNAQPGETYLANSNFLSESHACNHNAKYFVYNGVDPQEFPFEANKSDYVVFLARAKWRVKNLKTAIHWAKDLGVRLEVIGGSGVSTSAVRYHGSLSESEGKLEILKKARALVYPTNWPEPFGLALLEAWSCGTPVVASVNGAMSELVKPEVGFLCRNYDELLAAGRSMERIKPHVCRQYVESNYTSRHMAESYLRLINLVLEKGELDQSPRYALTADSVHLLYKPTLYNRLSLALTGKV